MSPDPTARAERLLEVGRADEAVAQLAIHLASAPQDAHALRLLCLAHLTRGDVGAAGAAAEAALRAEPSEESGYRLAAIAAGRAGRNRLALDHAEQAVRLAPTSWQARVVVSQALLNRRRARLAHHHAAEAVRLAPHHAATHLQVSIAAAARRQHRAARQALAQARMLDPTGPEALDYQAYRDVEQNRLTDAADSIQQSLRLNPTGSRGQDNLAGLMVALLARLVAVLLGAGIMLMLMLGAELDGALTAGWPRAMVGVLTIAVLALVMWRTLGAFPPAVRRHLLLLPRTFRGRRRVVLLVAAVVAISFAALAFLPATLAHWGGGGVLLTFGLGAAVSVASVFQELWHRMSRLVRSTQTPS